MGAKNSEYLVTKITDAEANEGYKKALDQRKKKSAKKKKTLGRGIVKEITVKFRSQRDAIKFAEEIHQTISIEDKKVTFDTSKRGKGKFVGEPVGKNRKYGLEEPHLTHWVGMPEFEQEDSKWEWHRLKVAFKNWDDYKKFTHVVRQFLKRTTSSIYFPEWTAAELKGHAWKSSLPRSKKNPRYPVYIVSKGRSYSRLTSKALEGLGVPYYIVVEPQDYDEYITVIDSKKVLKLPEDTDPENPTGPGRARNFCRDHSWMNGHQRHWVLDDNIEGFYRLHKNRRYKVGDGAIFRAAEDFVDRYKNVLVAGFQYRFFCAAKSKYPPFKENTRIYSCLLIDNSKLFKWKNGKRKRVSEKPIVVNAPKGKPMSAGMFLWRERYNEDTILSLDALENGYATIQFNAFLQGKTGTQKLAGGNSDLFYLSEEVNEEEQDSNGNYKNAGTVRKSLILEKVYGKVAKVVWKFNRPHHEVNYTKYQKIPLQPNFPQSKHSPNDNYGMLLVDINDTGKQTNARENLEYKTKESKSLLTPELHKKEIEKIFIPTVNRFDNQITFNHLPDDLKKRVVLVVQAWERKKYKLDCEYLVLPKSIKVGERYAIARTRNFIYEYAKNFKYAVLDDDITFYKRNAKYWGLASNMDTSKRRCTNAEIRNMFRLFSEWLDNPEITIASCGMIENPPAKTLFRNNSSISGCYWINGLRLQKILGSIDLASVSIAEDVYFILQLLKNGHGNRISNEFVFSNASNNNQLKSDLWDGITAAQALKDYRYIEKRLPEFFKILRDESGETIRGGYKNLGKVKVSYNKAYKSSRH